jgi:uracil-DNA glycosylase family 4
MGALAVGGAEWARLERGIVRCERCPRLRAFCREVARVKRRAYRDETYWGKPVPGFGDPAAGILVVGLAPAAHGGNRTGRVFTGDSSGDWLVAALHRAGLANQPTSLARADGLRLHGVFVSAAARCAPPDNRPTPEELRACAPWLDRELELLAKMRVVVALGRIAWDTVLGRSLRVAPESMPRPRPVFAHGAETRLVLREGEAPAIVLGSYHPSRQNTQTGRLTRRMLESVFERAKKRR